MNGRIKHAVSVFFILFIRTGLLHAQQPGTEYWFSFGNNYNPIPNDTVVYGSNTRYEVHIASLHHAEGTLHFIHTGDTLHFSVQPGHVFSHTLSRAQVLACYHNVPGDLGTVTDKAACVAADSTVSVSVIAQQLHSSDATQLLPVEAWGTDYQMIRQNGKYAMAGIKTQDIILLANSNGTVVRMNGNPVCTLNRGETYYQRFNENQSGCHFQSNHPVSMFNVQTINWIPDNGSGDKSLEQYYPLHTCGREFFVPVSCMDREFVQVMATENHTDIRHAGGTLRSDISGARKITDLSAGEWIWLEIFQKDKGCFISANKPVIVNSFMHDYTYNTPKTIYSDPSVVWISATAQRVRQGIVKAYEIPRGHDKFDTVPPIFFALIVSPTYGKESTTVSINGRTPQTLYGGQWKDHPSGWSYYDMSIPYDTLAYTFTNPFCGLQLYHYGIAAAESYFEQASCMYRNLNICFYSNDTHYLSLPALRFCEQEVVFRGEIHDSLMNQPGHIRWYIDSVEEVSARDSLVWRKFFKRGNYRIRMEVFYEDGFSSQSVESELHIVSLDVQVSTTPEYCRRSDGTISIRARSDLPASLSFRLDSNACTDSVCGLKSGNHRIRVSDACCELIKDVYVDSVQGPLADFTIQPETANVGMRVRFSDQSEGRGSPLVQWQWILDKNTKTYEQHPTHIYSEVSEDSIRLTVTDANSCTDSTSKAIHIVDNLEFPNAFAPVKSNGQPDFFRPMEDKGTYRSFEMLIYNRWGNLVWKQSCKGEYCPDYADDAFWWNGKDLKGSYVSAGVYFWIVKATLDSTMPPVTLQGSVTVFR